MNKLTTEHPSSLELLTTNLQTAPVSAYP